MLLLAHIRKLLQAVVPHRDAIWMHNIADGSKALELARTQVA